MLRTKILKKLMNSEALCIYNRKAKLATKNKNK